MRLRIYIALLLCSHLMGSCAMRGPNSGPSAIVSKTNANIEDFDGQYVAYPAKRAPKQQIVADEIIIDDYTSHETALQLIANSNDIARTVPSITATLIKSSDDARDTQTTTKYYMLGINKGPIDYVAYDFDDTHNAFERTTTTLKGNELQHVREVLYYKKTEPASKAKNAGYKVSHTFILDKSQLRVLQKVEKMGSPWTDVFKSDEDFTKKGTRDGIFVRLKSRKEKADILIPRSHRF